MSTIDILFETPFEIYRNSIVSDTSRDGFTLIDNAYGIIRQITDKTKLYNQDAMGNEYHLWTNINTPIKPNDRIISNGIIYNCIGVQTFIDPIDNTESHLQVILNKL